MLKKTMAVVFAIAIAMTAGSVGAQTCSLGVYADAEGTVNVYQPRTGDAFDVYVVLFVENAVNAVSYDLAVPGLNNEIFIQSTAFGPQGGGFSITTSNGENVGLGECAIGFGGLPIVVADYTMLMPVAAPERTLSILPNPDESTEFPVINDCANQLSPCGIGPSLIVETPVATQATSFGAVKSLYN